MAQPLAGSKKGGIIKLSRDQRKAINRQFFTLATELVSRASLADKLGKSYWPASGGNAQRDLYKTLGYELNPNFNSYYARYRRQDIAKAVVEALPNACWRLKPTVVDSKEQGSTFEIELEKVIKEKKIWQLLSRADRISGIGEFGAILMGFDDSKDLAEPLLKASRLIYLRPYTQEFITVDTLVDDNTNERYGLPETYLLSVAEGTKNTTSQAKKEMKVHFSRIIHVSEGLVEDDLYGTPRLEAVLNRLQDLEMIAGGSSEMFWRGAFPGYAFKAQADAQFDPESLEDLEDEIQDYLHELRRYIRLQGIDVQELQPQVSDPTNHVDVLVTLIAVASRIPKRILLGSEPGELASSQDERAWLDRVDERRTDHCEANIIRPLVNSMILAGCIPEPASGEYNVVWPPLIVMGDKDKTEIARLATEALSKYVGTPGLSTALPFEMYLKKYLGWTEDEIDQAKELLGQDMEKALGEEEEERKAMEREAAAEAARNLPPNKGNKPPIEEQDEEEE
jgi:hypothetical protein